jgi:hypothetical protein
LCNPANLAFTMSKIRSMRGYRILKLMFRRIHLLRGLACRAVARDHQPVFALRASTRQPSLALRAKAGGANRDRTDDLMLAKHALSQLSYGPGLQVFKRRLACRAVAAKRQRLVGPGRVERPTSRLSGVRSNHLSYEPDVIHAAIPTRIGRAGSTEEGKRRGRHVLPYV